MEIKNDRHAEWYRLWTEKGLSPLKAYQEVYPNAGYNTACVEATRLKKRYIEGMFDEVQDRIQQGSKKAVYVLEAILSSNDVPAAVKLKAATAMLGYAGHNAVEKQEISVTDKSEEEIDRRLMQLMKDEAIEADVVH